MSGPSFTSPPAAEAEEMSRIHYEMAYTEDISQRMRIPETLKVAAAAAACVQQQQQQQPPPHAHSALMQVPERIVVAAADGDPRLSCPRDLDLIQSVPATAELLDMKAPPRVLTLSRQPLDSLETRQISKSDPAHAAPSRSGRERGAGEMASARHSGQCNPLTFCPPGPHVPPAVLPRGRRRQPDDGGGLPDLRPVRHAAGLPAVSPGLGRQPATIVKLNRRLQMLEEENKERSRREVLLYSATVAFWLFNTWVWFRR
ncbi:mitochondrial fission factor-like isoform X2 [Corythoichthys intestinalis]|uniref:mitochondrial fission factor-like isoform X2 n=1 Tax=Corythoichthys intestinalis TaxID=161448 RepID=UPI0025A675C1|nr:mitochondrial fission factor-like isoform X2 [Corythoichthys intestinalis]